MRSTAIARLRFFQGPALLLGCAVGFAVCWFTWLQPVVITVIAWVLWFGLVVAAFMQWIWLQRAYRRYQQRQHRQALLRKAQRRADGRL
jgi:hypothetical protein